MPTIAKLFLGATEIGGGIANADFSNTATGTYTDGNGFAWKYVQFNSSGTLTVTTEGLAEVLIVSGGGGAGANSSFVAGAGGGGAAYFTPVTLTAVAHTVTVGAGGAGGTQGAQGNLSGIKSPGFTGLRMGIIGGAGGAYSTSIGFTGSSGSGGSNNTGGIASFGGTYGGNGTNYASGGAGGDATANSLAGIGPGVSSDITGTAIVYGRGNFWSGYATTANRGEGGNPSANAGSSGVVIVRVRTN